MSEYWEERYKTGGNSGAGSYGEFAEHKANVINNYIIKYNISTISDFGCGDGNQISLLAGFDNYIGYDVSKEALFRCEERHGKNSKMKFCYSLEEIPDADMCLSLDVIYHIIDDNDYEKYMDFLFKKSKRLVLIYSSNKDSYDSSAPHVKHRKFSEWIENNHIDFKLIDIIGNNLQTSAQFYLYKRI